MLSTEHRTRNLFREEWWRHIKGREHRWAHALNSSQCFAVSLFASLSDDASMANRFIRRMLPKHQIKEDDQVSPAFEHSPSGVAERLGERGQATQIDVFFTVIRDRRVYGATRWLQRKSSLMYASGFAHCLDSKGAYLEPPVRFSRTRATTPNARKATPITSGRKLRQAATAPTPTARNTTPVVR